MIGALFLASPSPGTAPPPFGGNVITFSFLLSLMLWVPIAAAIVIAAWPDRRPRFVAAGFFVNAFVAFLALIAYIQFTGFSGGFQFEERLPWIAGPGIEYHLALDGVGMALLLLGCVGGLCAMLASAGIRDSRSFVALMLTAQGAANGVIFARDLFLLAAFWIAAAIPVAMLVRGWGGTRAEHASRRLLLYTAAGSAALLAAILLLFASAGGFTFDAAVVAQAVATPRLQVVVGILVMVAAATRLPLIPLHGWTRDVLADAAPGVAVWVAVEFMRTGGYLLIRLWVGLDHDGARLLAPFLAAAGGATCVWAGLRALGERDLRGVASRLAIVPGGVAAVACAGLTPLSLNGAVLQLVAGGLAAGLLVLAAAGLAERVPNPTLEGLSGAGQRSPRLAWALILGCLAMIGIPGFLSFLSGFMTFGGAIRSQPAGVILALAGLLISAAAAAAVLRRVVAGATSLDLPLRVRELGLAEFWALAVLAGALIWFGTVPSGPKLAGITFFDPGITSVVNGGVGDLASPYESNP